MRFRIHIGIDPHGDRGGHPHLPGHLIEPFEFGFGFEVEAQYPRFQPRPHLGPRLAHPRKDDLLRRNPCAQRPFELPARHHVRPDAFLRGNGQHRLIGIGLHRIGDQRIEPGERLAHHPYMPPERRPRIAIERRADLIGNRRERHVLGKHLAIAIIEMMHHQVLLSSAAGAGKKERSCPSICDNVPFSP